MRYAYIVIVDILSITLHSFIFINQLLAEWFSICPAIRATRVHVLGTSFNSCRWLISVISFISEKLGLTIYFLCTQNSNTTTKWRASYIVHYIRDRERFRTLWTSLKRENILTKSWLQFKDFLSTKTRLKLQRKTMTKMWLNLISIFVKRQTKSKIVHKITELMYCP